MREAFAKENPEIVKRVLAAYEEARKWALENPAELKKIFIGVTKLPEAVVERQLSTRTELNHSVIGDPQRESILAAGLALQQAGVIPSDTDVKATVDKLIDPSYLDRRKSETARIDMFRASRPLVRLKPLSVPERRAARLCLCAVGAGCWGFFCRCCLPPAGRPPWPWGWRVDG